MNSKRELLRIFMTALSLLSINALYLSDYSSNKLNTCLEPYFPKECSCLINEN